jgi:RsiW-degrading membrane proteinase PrsW (M82 family)
MRILRSVKRRGFDVGTAGYFSVLRQNTWFAASRLSDGFESLVGRSNRKGSTGSAEQEPWGGLSARGSAAAQPALGLILYPHRPMRTAAIVCLAIALTLALLWWIMHPGRGGVGMPW